MDGHCDAADRSGVVPAGSATAWTRSPGRGSYARAERERRFLLRADPPPGEAARRIDDLYLGGTTLRLRHVRGEGADVYKLTQKVRVRADDPAQVRLTNTYLTAAEHALLATLPGHRLAKTRTVHRLDRHDLVVDVFAGRWTGLRLVEVEVDDLAEPLDLPAWVGAEVTADDRWSGGALAAAPEAAVAALLSELAITSG